MGVSGAFMLPHPPIIIPSIGKGEESRIGKTAAAYREAAGRIRRMEPETIVLLSPHQTMYADYFHISPGNGARGDFGAFGAREEAMEVLYDTEFVRALCRRANAQGLAAGTLGERERNLDHGTMVPLYFINSCWSSYRLVRIGLSGLPLTMHYELGKCIRETADRLGRRSVIVASGDLSHRLKEDGPYGYQEEGPAYDRQIMEVMGNGDFGRLFAFPETFCEKAGECGHRSFVVMAGALDGVEVKAEALSYEGPFGVGYGICCYEAGGDGPGRRFLEMYEEQERQRIQAIREREDAYVGLARRAVEEYVSANTVLSVPEDLPEELYRSRAGAFVSIKEAGALRGCIGTIEAVQPSLAEEIIENAVSACSRDPRFPAVERRELGRLEISVDVLGEKERIASPEELDVKRYGVIVSNGARRGLLLPDLEGVDTAEQQIAIARNKAGIAEGETVTLERFEVVRHHAESAAGRGGEEE